MTFNCALCDAIVHLTFQVRKVLVTKNSNQTSRRSLPGVWTAGHESNKFKCCEPVAMASVTTLLFAMQYVG